MARLLVWLAMAAALGVAVMFGGNVFPDEGWYLYAGRMVADGRVPYRDFAFFQAPLSAYLFGFAGGDLMWGRALSLFCGLGAIGFALDLARMRSRDALVAAALLLVPATYTLRWFAVARNIAPASMFLVLGVWLAERRVRVGRHAVGLAAVALAVAAGFRLSAAGGLAALVLHEWICGRRREAALGAFAGGGALAAILIPFFVCAPEGFAFGTVGYHLGLHPAGGWLEQALAKAQGLWRIAEHHHLLVLCVLVSLVRWTRSGELLVRSPGTCLPALAAGFVTALHMVAGRVHPEYHEMVVPLLAVVAALGCTRELAPLRWWRRPVIVRAGVLALGLVQLAGASAHLWANGVGWSPRLVEQVAAELVQVAPVGEPVLTFVPDFALGADLPLTPGLEMASVSVARPEMGVVEAGRLHMVTLPMLAEELRARRPGAVVWRAFEDADARRVELYGDAERAAVEAALRAGYQCVSERHGWTLWRRKSA